MAAQPGCPPTVGAEASLPVSTVDTGGRLVPAEPPAAALVCAYGVLSDSSSSELVGQRALTGRLDGLAADLHLAPGSAPAAVACPAARPTPHLLRLSYPGGTVWLRSDVGGCRGTRTASGASATEMGDVLAASLARGDWTVPPLPDTARRCVPDRVGRGAGAGSLLPAGFRALTLCRRATGSVRRAPASPSDVAAVREVLSGPVAVPVRAGCNAGAPYELAATYPAGPAVLVRYAPRCDPEVENGSLAAQLDPGARRRLDAVLSGAFRVRAAPDSR